MMKTMCGPEWPYYIVVGLLGLAAVLILSACVGDAPPISTTMICPQLSQYSPEFRNKLADEIDKLPTGSALGQAMTDYRRLRDDIRACHNS